MNGVKDLPVVAYSLSDIMRIFGIKRSAAAKMMGEAKQFGDRLKVRGRIHREDLKEYLEWRRERRTNGL